MSGLKNLLIKAEKAAGPMEVLNVNYSFTFVLLISNSVMCEST